MNSMTKGPRRTLLAVLLVALTAPAYAGAETMQERFDEANSAYYHHDYVEAATQYEHLIDRYRLQDPAVFYNLGNCYHQREQYGRAVLWYKRAQLFSPNESLETQITENLDFTFRALINRHRKDVGGTVAVLDETHGIAYSLFHFYDTNTYALTFLVLWLLLMASLIGRRLLSLRSGPDAPPPPTWVHWLRITRNIALPIATVSAILLAGHLITNESVLRAIVVKDNVQMRDGRHPDAPRADVPEGLEIEIVDDTDPNEVRIRLSNGKEGWVGAGAVEKINL